MTVLFVGACSAQAPRAASAESASITFVDNAAADGLLACDFQVHGLPAVDTATGAIVVPDVFHGFIASGLGLELRWLRPHEELRRVAVLDPNDASRVLYEDGDETELLSSIRTRTREANGMLRTLDLRPTTPCIVKDDDLRCGALEATLHDDELRWRAPTGAGATKLGWKHEPMEIGDGPPKEMQTSILEAHLDPETQLLAARVQIACREPGSDACFLPDTWRAVTLR